MKLKSILIFTIFIFNAFQISAMGLGDWGNTTSNGTRFAALGDGTRIYLKNGTEFKYGKEWYFYKIILLE